MQSILFHTKIDFINFTQIRFSLFPITGLQKYYPYYFPLTSQWSLLSFFHTRLGCGIPKIEKTAVHHWETFSLGTSPSSFESLELLVLWWLGLFKCHNVILIKLAMPEYTRHLNGLAKSEEILATPAEENIMETEIYLTAGKKCCEKSPLCAPNRERRGI